MSSHGLHKTLPVIITSNFVVWRKKIWIKGTNSISCNHTLLLTRSIHTNDFTAKISVVYDSIAIGRTDGALVRFISAIGPGETPQDADARLLTFMDEVVPRLPRFIPGEGELQ